MKKVILVLLLLTLPTFGQSESKKDTVQLHRVNEKQVLKLISSLKGKVVLVNIWATWCKPCVVEFPHLVRIQKTYEKKGVKVIFVSVDELEFVETGVRPFLQKQNVTFPSYIKDSMDDEQFIDAIGKGWRGAIPTTFVYDRKGKQVAMLVGSKDFETFEAVIRPLLR